MSTTNATDFNALKKETNVTTLQQTIQRLDKIKHELMDSANKSKSNATRQRELKAAVDIHKVTKRLEAILQTLVPFEIDAITTEPCPNQQDLFHEINHVIERGVTA
jgi:hypothetical protein